MERRTDNTKIINMEIATKHNWLGNVFWRAVPSSQARRTFILGSWQDRQCVSQLFSHEWSIFHLFWLLYRTYAGICTQQSESGHSQIRSERMFQGWVKFSKFHSRLGGLSAVHVIFVKLLPWNLCFEWSRHSGRGNGTKYRDRRVENVKKRKSRNTSQSEKERGDGYSTGEICSHHKGNIEECLGGNSSIFASSSSSCPVFSSLIIPLSSCTNSFSSPIYLPICTLSPLLLKYKKAILKTKVQWPACYELHQICN